MTSSFRPESTLPPFVADPLPHAAHSFSGGADAAPDEAEAAPDLERLEREAFARGHESGRAELPWDDAEALRSACRALEAAAQELREAASAGLEAQREGALEIALAVAGRILECELSGRLDAVAPLVTGALEALAEPHAATLYLAPADVETLGRGEAPELEEIARRAGMTTAADARLRPGDARLQAGATEVDASRDAILARFRDELSELIPLAEAPDSASGADTAPTETEEDA